MERKEKYDYLILGTGNSALTLGALLAHAGYRVCMLEAHDIPGGYAQSFKWGDFYFCGQVHYIWGCGKGGRIYEFLKHIGLEKEITFELFDPDGYDHMVMPDGKRVKIPYGFENLALSIDAAYPGQGEKVRKFTAVLDRIRHELKRVPDRAITPIDILTQGWQYPTLLRYRTSTLQDVFDECELSKESQAVLIANAGDMMSPPNELTIFAYMGLFCGYNTGAYYPTKHFKHYIDTLANFITSHRGCHIFYEAQVSKIHTSGDRVTKVETVDGRVFSGTNVVSNIDPKRTAEMIGMHKFPRNWQHKLEYKYSPSGIMIYLGLKNADLKKHGFGSYNIWHLEQWDMNKMWEEQAHGDFSNPWIFISTHTLHTKERGTVAPKDCDIMEIATYTEYQWLKDLRDKDFEAYEREKSRLAERMIDIVEQHYFPDIRKHIITKVIGSASTNEDYAWAPQGNAYGMAFTPNQVGPGRFGFNTPWSNFYLCNATAGYAGMHGTTGNGCNLYQQLTGDVFYSGKTAPTDEELIAALPSEYPDRFKDSATALPARIPEREAPSVQGAFK
ncbi:MAG: NAD(P)/FAD-dependent oxidoreductase [Patescibacteria group bacterium]